MSYILLVWLLAPIWWPISLIRRLLSRKPRRIIIFEIAGIGDVVCSAYLFEQLRERYPDATIDLVVDPVAATLAPALPILDRVIQFPYARQRGFMGRLHLIKLCAGYDVGVCLIPSAAQLTGFCLSAMPWRLSILPGPLNRSYRWLRPLMTETAIHQPGTYFPQTQAQLLSCLDLHHANPTKQLSSSTLVTVDLSEINPSTILVGLLVGSGRPLKRLELDQMLRLSEGIAKLSPNINVVFIGGATDKNVAEQLIKAVVPETRNRIINLAGCCTLAELPSVLVRLALLIGVDSGVTHMADALGVPIICIAGPVDLGEVYQLSERRVLLETNLPCHPCSRVFDTPASCHLGHKNCLRQLDVADVLANAQRLLGVAHA